MNFEEYMAEQQRIAAEKWHREHAKTPPNAGGSAAHAKGKRNSGNGKSAKLADKTSQQPQPKETIAARTDALDFSSPTNDKTPTNRHKQSRQTDAYTDTSENDETPMHMGQSQDPYSDADKENPDEADREITPTKSNPSKPITAGYKNREEMKIRMGLDPNHRLINIHVRKRREHMTEKCHRRGFAMDKPFHEIEPVERYRLIRGLTLDMKKKFGNEWDRDLTSDLLHTILLDKIRNERARKRAETTIMNQSGDGMRTNKAATVPVSEVTPAINKRKKSAPRPEVIDSGDESDAADSRNYSKNKRKAPGTAHIMAVPPPVLDYGSNDPNSTMEQQAQESYLAVNTTPASHTFGSSPPSSSPPNEQLITHEPEATALTVTGKPQTARNKMGPTQSVVQQEQTPTVVPVFIKGKSPIYIACDAGYIGFEKIISRHLTWDDTGFLLYRARSLGNNKAGPWQAIGREEDWMKVVNKFSEVGIIVKVADASWYESGGESEDDDDFQPQSTQYPASQPIVRGAKKNQSIPKAVEAPKSKAKSQSKHTAKRQGNRLATTKSQPVVPATESQVEIQVHGTQLPESQFNESQFQETQFDGYDLPVAQIEGTQIEESQVQATQDTGSKPKMKRKVGRPRKEPNSLANGYLPKPGPISTRPKSIRSVQKSKKAQMIEEDKEQRRTNDDIAIIRGQLKERQKNFSI